MIPSVEFIKDCFGEYNVRFFGGALPPVPVKLSHAKGFLGKLTFTRRRHGLFGLYQNEDFVLRINARIDLPEELVRDTVLHEMIHYYIAYNRLKDTSVHGTLFRKEMNRINTQGKRHITISHRLTEEQRQQALVHKTRVVALVHFADGRTGVKVVPDNPGHIAYWHKTALRRFPLDAIEWFLSDDDFFARYPSSFAMRIYLIDNPDSIPLATARPINSCQPS